MSWSQDIGARGLRHLAFMHGAETFKHLSSSLMYLICLLMENSESREEFVTLWPAVLSFLKSASYHNWHSFEGAILVCQVFPWEEKGISTSEW